MPYYASVFSGPVPVEILEEIEQGALGRLFRVRVTRGTAKGYKKGVCFDAHACYLWDSAQRSRASIHIAWAGRTWLDNFPTA